MQATVRFNSNASILLLQNKKQGISTIIVTFLAVLAKMQQ